MTNHLFLRGLSIFLKGNTMNIHYIFKNQRGTFFIFDGKNKHQFNTMNDMVYVIREGSVLRHYNLSVPFNFTVIDGKVEKYHSLNDIEREIIMQLIEYGNIEKLLDSIDAET